MKKTLLLTSFAIVSIVSLDAQITITSANMPVSNNMYINGRDTAITSYGTAGANQTWNFAAWTNDSPDTASFSAPSSLNGGSNFPTATIGTGDEQTSIFLKVSSTQMEILGYYADFGSGPMAIEFMPAQKFITFPSTYQTMFTNSSTYDVTINPGQMGVDSIRIKSTTYTSSNVDGWGTLTTPAYSGLSSIRQFITETRTDSTWGLLTGQTTWMLYNSSVDTSYTYRWWSNAHTFPVAEVTFNEGDVVYEGSYLSSTMVGVNELAQQRNNVLVYPNPASESVNFKGAAEGSVLIVFDQNGKMVEQTTLKRNNNSINTTGYTNGLYFYNIITTNGTSITKGKFAVTK
ncbi:MAG: T9SS type A sorting domain-containing protein [Bacteroidia bacterium]|jgi:hypothetical protein